MAVNFNTVLDAVSENYKVTGSTETVRSVSNSPLVSGVPVGVGTGLLNSDLLSQSARIFAGSDPARTGGNQDDKGQILPATDNKIPRIYGQVTTGGVVTDAVKSGSNTIFVCFTISETRRDRYDLYEESTTGIWQDWRITGIYRDGQECEVATFDNASSYASGASKVLKLTDVGDPNTNADISAANVINVWAWAGNSHANAQIFPYYPVSPGSSLYRSNAYDIMPNWSNTDTMDNLVFAVVEIDRLNEDIDANANVEIDEVGEFRFTISTKGYEDQNLSSSTIRKLHNPAVALHDYLVDPNYGCGLSNADIDLTSLDSWRDYCEESMYYASSTFVPGSTFYSPYYIATDDKRRCDIFLNPQAPVLDNINEICKAGSATFTYDRRQGKFKVLINKEMTAGEKANAFSFSSDNIISSIRVNSTDLYSLFNFTDCSFPNYLQQDRSDNVIIEIPAADRATNEPVSGSNFSILGITDRFRAMDLANTSLKQSRIGTTYSFSGDHSTLGVDVGDYVTITDKTKNLDNKYARVMRVVEREEADGSLVCDYICLEYKDTPYEEFIYFNTSNDPLGGSLGSVENWTTSTVLSNDDAYETYDLTLGNVYVVDDPASGNGSIYDYTGNLLATDTVTNLAAASLLPVSFNSTGEPWAAVQGPGPTITFNKHKLTATNQNADPYGAPSQNSVATEFTGTPGPASPWTWFKLNKVTPGTYTFTLQYEKTDRIPSRFSLANVTGNITVSGLDCITPSDITLANVYYGAGTQLQDTYNLSNIVGSKNYIVNMETPRQYNICNIQSGNFTVTNTIHVNWSSLVPHSNLSVNPRANITFVNTANVNTSTFEIPLGGIDLLLGEANILASGIKGVPQTFTSTMSTDRTLYGLDEDWYPSRCNVWVQGRHYETTGLAGNVVTNMTYIPRVYNYKV